METEEAIKGYSMFRFLRHLPIPEALKRPVPGLDILHMKIPMPEVLEQTISFKSFFYQDQKKNRKKRSVSENNPKEKIPTQLCIHVSGPLARGYKTNFSVNGQDIELLDGTWIFGELRLGSLVQVHGNENIDGIMQAQKIIVL